MSTRKSSDGKIYKNLTMKISNNPARSHSTNTTLALIHQSYPDQRNEIKQKEKNDIDKRVIKRNILENFKKIQQNNDKRKEAIVKAEKNKSSIADCFEYDDEGDGTWRTTEGAGIKLKKKLKLKRRKTKKILYKNKSKTKRSRSIAYKK